MTFRKKTFDLLVPILLAAAGQFFLVQREVPWTLGLGLLLYLAAGYLFVRGGPGPAVAKPLSPDAERAWLVLVAAVVLFFRLYRLSDVPPGMSTEVVSGPWLGYALPPAQWTPYYTGGLALTHPDIPLWGWAWFHLMEPSRLSYGLFYAFLSLAAFPLGYLLFRDLAGARVALLSLFFWGVMEWQFTLGRNGHPVTTLPLYLLGAVFFLRSAWRGHRLFSWALAGLLAGLSYYAYPAARAILPLLALLSLGEWNSSKGKAPFPWGGVALCLGLTALTAWPALRMLGPSVSWLTGAPMGSHLSVGWQVLQQKSLWPLWDNLLKVGLVFNRIGPANGMEGLPGRPLLDDVTGILFVLGSFGALVRFRESRHFYPCAALAVLCLPALLSDHPYHTRRMLGMAPFIAYLAALAALEIWRRASSGNARRWVLAAGILAAVVAAGENYKTYFVDRVQNEECWSESDADATAVGQAIAEGGDAYDYYLSPAFYQRFQVLFLGHGETAHMRSLEMPDCSRYLPPTPGRGLFFALQRGRTGVLSLLQGRYPGGTTQRLDDPWGRPYLYLFRVPPEACAPSRFVPLRPGRYWQGTYWTSVAPWAQPVLQERDPVLNFSDRNDFPVKNAEELRVEWRGTLHPPKPGSYQFLISATDATQAELVVDGRKVAVKNQEVALTLGPRDYAVVVRLLKKGGFESAFHLAWQKPGDSHYEILPPEAMK